jgi:hypothetical protein
VKLSRLLLLTAIVFYVLYDIVSTLAAFNFLGSFEYEKSFLIKAAFNMAGVPGFIVLKVVMSAAAILAAYLLMEHYTRLKAFGAGILAGASAAGLFVGTSNFNILVNGSSIWILGLDSGTVAAIIIVLFAVAGLLMARPGPIKNV